MALVMTMLAGAQQRQERLDQAPRPVQVGLGGRADHGQVGACGGRGLGGGVGRAGGQQHSLAPVGQLAADLPADAAVTAGNQGNGRHRGPLP
jgi:hypothetical protein